MTESKRDRCDCLANGFVALHAVALQTAQIKICLFFFLIEFLAFGFGRWVGRH